MKKIINRISTINSGTKLWLLVTLIITSFQFLNAGEPVSSTLLKVNYTKLVSKADLYYSTPV